VTPNMCRGLIVAPRTPTMPQLSVRQTVILAAGFGSRLSATRGDLPKPLVRVAGKTLLDHALGQAAAAGCDEAIVVTGNAAEMIRDHLASVRTALPIKLVHNERYQEPNGVSLMTAEPLIDGPFFLQMADHLFAEPVLPILADRLSAPAGYQRLLVDFKPVGIDEDDATKVKVQHGRITAIGKDVWEYDAVDTGYFLLDPRVFGALKEVAQVEPPSVTLGMRKLIAANQLAAVSLTGVRWTDVDTPEDYSKAELLLASAGRRQRIAAN
jgi:choline kinase